jgi:hypothetical protein
MIQLQGKDTRLDLDRIARGLDLDFKIWKAQYFGSCFDLCCLIPLQVFTGLVAQLGDP